MRFNQTILLAFVALGIFSITACKKKEEDKPQNNTYTVPTQYNFSDAVLNDGRVRVLLIDDLNNKITAAKTAVTTASDFLAIYNNTANTYASMANVTIASENEANYDTQLKTYFNQLASVSGTNTNVVDSIDLRQLSMKTLWGALNYKQGTTLLNNIGSVNNSNPSSTYTDAEKNWDLAFAYLGGTIDMNDYTVAQKQAATKERDTDGNSTLDRTKERNLLYAFYAMRMDEETTWGGAFPENERLNVTKTLMDNFLKGRAAISNNDNTKRDEAKTAILAMYEKSIAVSIIHYLKLQKDLVVNPAEQGINGKRVSNWSECLGFVNMLAYNPAKKITDTQINQLKAYFGNKPYNMTVTNCDDARSLLNSIYGFSTYQFTNF